MQRHVIPPSRLSVLITGGAGFIGQHLAALLEEAGHSVRLLDALIPQAHPATDRSTLAGELVVGDINQPAIVARALEGIDAVIHLAAEVGVGQSMYEIERYVRTNDSGTATLLQAMMTAKVKRLVVASSMSVYGEGRYVAPDGTVVDDARRGWSRGHAFEPRDARDQPLRPAPTPESKPANCRSVYALNKFVQEQLCLLYGAHYGVHTVALRLFNVYGPGQALSNPYTGVLANFASRIMNGERPLIFEDGRQLRDFVHVSDVARAFQSALERDDLAGEIFNIGSGRPISIAEVAEQLIAVMGSRLAPEISGQIRAGDVRHCFPDISKARDRLGFIPTMPFEDGTRDLVGWLAGQTAEDRGRLARAELERRGLVV